MFQSKSNRVNISITLLTIVDKYALEKRSIKFHEVTTWRGHQTSSSVLFTAFMCVFLYLFQVTGETPYNRITIYVLSVSITNCCCVFPPGVQTAPVSDRPLLPYTYLYNDQTLLCMPLYMHKIQSFKLLTVVLGENKHFTVTEGE